MIATIKAGNKNGVIKASFEAMKMGITQSIVWVALGTFTSLMLLDWLTPVKEINNSTGNNF